MLKILLSLALLITAVVPAGYAQNTGTLFFSDKGYFTVRMPGASTKEERANDGYTGNGKVTSVVGNTIYAVEYKCLCDDLDTPEHVSAALLNIAARIQTGTNQTINSQTDIVLNESDGSTQYPGKEFKLESESLSSIYHVYIAYGTSYLVSVVSEKSAPAPDTADFFSSFRRGRDPKQTTAPTYPAGVKGANPGPVVGGLKEIPKDAPRMATTSPPNNPQTPSRVQRSEGVIKGNAIRLVTPMYPPLARQEKVEGRVQVEILIDEEGNVISAGAKCGHPFLVDAAVQAARGSLFKPVLLAGVPVKVQGLLTYNFRF